MKFYLQIFLLNVNLVEILFGTSIPKNKRGTFDALVDLSFIVLDGRSHSML